MSNAPKLSQPVSITPPIPDANGNGALDIYDIITQMRHEEEQGNQRTPNERAHGVFEALGAREVSAEILKAAIAQGMNQKDGNPCYTGSELRQARDHVQKELLNAATSINDKLIQDPNMRKKIVAAVEAAAKEQNIPAADKAVILADQHSLIDFAQTFNTVFPNGIKLTPDDMPALLSHFGKSFPASAMCKKPAGVAI